MVGPGRGIIADYVTDPTMADRGKFAIRGDIDALPIQDHKSVEYCSVIEGVMHACGHDVHTAVIFGALDILVQLQTNGMLPWPVAARGIFQPAEEICEGAKYMIHHHALADVNSILALHVDPTRPVGRIGIRSGPMTAACDLIQVRFLGRGGHGARPHLTIDPIEAMTQWIQTALGKLPRIGPPDETIVFSVGQVEAGHSANVIPDEAVLAGSLRSLDNDVRNRAMEVLEAIGVSIFQQTQCRVELNVLMSAPAVINDDRLTKRLARLAGAMFEPGCLQWIEKPSMGSEDFSYYLERLPGAMFRLGVAGPQVGHEPLHTPTFDVDESAIAIGARMMAAAVIDHFSPTEAHHETLPTEFV